MAEDQLSPEQMRRKAALRYMADFADLHGCSNREWREQDRGDAIAFIGTTNDGRDFCMGYLKDAA